jgi:hypothetical protein
VTTAIPGCFVSLTTTGFYQFWEVKPSGKFCGHARAGFAQMDLKEKTIESGETF